MSIIAYLNENGRIVDVRRSAPLPVEVRNNEGSPLPTESISLDTLLVATTTVDTTANRDLLGSTSTELPTLDGCGQYRKLVWFYFRAGADTTTYRVLARATDLSGVPLGTGWITLATGTLPGEANTWGRIDIPASGDGYYDQYRIEVQRTAGSSNYSLTSKIVGVR
jgi:hypothetical protein